MKSFFALLCASSLLLATGCASIVSKSNYPFTVNATPKTAKITIKDDNMQTIFTGSSPATVDLKAGNGFFKKASYTLVVTAPGYEEMMAPINFKVDGWYFGNILFGGFVGLLIVDPLTGAMFKIEREYMQVNLQPDGKPMGKAELKIMDINDIPETWKPHLVRLSE
ncbi:hypothetical protein [Lewinella sp. 4G2]|uniref:hypothetical protein n=1 Tax=Lewinella sp. 4G2 TaxID=1803372 RepID=UPI0007E0B3BC|nr:hypothetical protein [Lewinella sp. 4G2]OAV45924.1 hypothetical protein A3850_013645 [Lewinella sp. 4G2]